MKHYTSIHCNLCQKSFITYEDFSNHLSNDHLPKFNLTCTLCEALQTSLEELHIHLNSTHKLNKVDVSWDIIRFNHLFANISDVRLHTKQCAEWIEQSFSFGLESMLIKRDIRTIIMTSYSQEFKEFKDDCEQCNDTSTSRSYCGYCGQHFSRRCHLKVHVLRDHISLPDDLKKTLNMCDACKTPFRSRKLLIQHSICEHSTKMTKILRKPQFCNFCNKKLANKSNLNRHLVNKHSEEIGAPVNTLMFTCDHCKCYFSNKSSLKRHIENLHMNTAADTKKKISCFQCDQRFNSIRNLNAHLTLEHGVKINEEKLQFSHITEFFSWKQEEEIRTNSRFIQLRGLRKHRRRGDEISTLKFVCHRSGNFRSKANGKRADRIKGSSKMGRYCSAYIEIRFKENDTVTGNYCSTHSGHDNDLRYLNLTMDEKREIYDKIKNGASFTSILNEIRNDVGKEIKRKHLLTNKDLHNIVATFKRIPTPAQDEPFALRPDPYSDPPSDKNDRNFNTDLDLCCDLWVDTCQRMVNRFDQNVCKEPKPKDTSIVDDSTENYAYVNNHDYCLNSAPNAPQQSYYKTQSYSSYENERAISATSDPHRLTHEFYPAEFVNVDAHGGTNNINAMSSQHSYNSYNYADKLASTSNLDDDGDHFDDLVGEAEPQVEDKNKRDVPDLRDRVNSVTALYNMVESELDDRKKDIIRNYVDNMFRVLQYRYNKTKTKTKQTKNQVTPSQEKKFKNRSQSTNKKCKNKTVPDHSSASLNASSEYASKAHNITYTSANSLNNSTVVSLIGKMDGEMYYV